MVTNVHISRISEKPSANDFVCKDDTFKNDANDVTDCPDLYPAQTISSSWASFLTGQHDDNQTLRNKNEHKYPIRIFTIQPEA